MDFSAANLPITATGQKAVLAGLQEIDKGAEKIVVSASKMSDALKRTNGDLAAAARLVVQEEQEVAAAIEQVTAATTRSYNATATAAEGMNVRSARATQGVARGLEMVARTGKLTGRSLDAVLANVSGLALGFGPGGVLVGAIGIATAAIVEMFMRTRKELEKTQIEFNKRLGEMANSYSLAGLSGRDGLVTKLYSGDPFASAVGKNPGESDLQFLARSEGIEGLRKQLARDRAAVPKGLFGQGSSAADKVRETKKMLDEMVNQYDRAMSIIKRVSDTVVDETSNGIKIAADKKKFSLGPMPGIASLPYGMTGMGMDNLNAGLINDAKRSWRQQLVDLQDQYVVEAATAKTVEERERAYAKIAETMKKISALSPWELDMKEKGDGVRVAKIGTEGLSARMIQAETEAAESVKRYVQIADRGAQQITATLASTVSKGFAAAFAPGASTKSIFKALTGAILEGIGAMFMQIGESALAGLAFMAKIKAAILSFAPEVGIAAALGLIAVGAALSAGGQRIASSGSGGSSYTSQSYNPISNQGYINPSAPASGTSAAGITPRANVTNVNYIIGPADPQAQRMWDELQRSSANRGTLGS